MGPASAVTTTSATVDGTQRYAARSGHPATAYRRLGRTGLSASLLGFGAYRVDDHHPAHEEALRRALGAGVNLIDTSTNYGDGASERLIGRVLAGDGAPARDEVIVVSKIGYVQGQNLALAHARLRSGRPFAEMVEYADRCWHCIHPDFLADQLDRSLERLGLARLDVCLLHNPEYFLSDAKRHGLGHLPALRERYYERLRRAFAHLEAEVARGRIGWYGVSSNTFVEPAADPEATSLSRLCQLAEEAGGAAHHFAVAELPLNFLESGAMLQRNNNDQTTLHAALQHEVAVLVNRPLNALRDEQLLRMSDGAGRNDEVHAFVDRHLPPAIHAAPLSQKALGALAHTPGVTSVLCGMRTPAYVDDAAAVLDWAPFAVEPTLYEAFQ